MTVRQHKHFGPCEVKKTRVTEGGNPVAEVVDQNGYHRLLLLDPVYWVQQ